MSLLLETHNRRFFAPTVVFGGRFRHPCMASCGNEMIVPDPATPGAPERLEEGQIWACVRCMALHEYYIAYSDGGRNACVRLLKGDHVRGNGEPGVTEFIP